MKDNDTFIRKKIINLKIDTIMFVQIMVPWGQDETTKEIQRFT